MPYRSISYHGKSNPPLAASYGYIVHEEPTRLHVKLAQRPVGGHRHTNRQQHPGHVPVVNGWSNMILLGGLNPSEQY